MFFTKRLVAYSTLLVCIAGFVFASPATAESWGVDFWHMSDLENQICRCEKRKAELERADQAITDRTLIRQNIVRNLCEDRIRFTEAVSGFMTLNQTEPAGINYLRLTHPNKSDYELASIQVMMHVRAIHGAQSPIFRKFECESVQISGS